jgi:hypothetical protein
MDILIEYRILPNGTPHTKIKVNGLEENNFSPFAVLYDLPISGWFGNIGKLLPALMDVTRGRPYHLTFIGTREDFLVIKSYIPEVQFKDLEIEDVNQFLSKCQLIAEEASAVAAMFPQKEISFCTVADHLRLQKDPYDMLDGLQRLAESIRRVWDAQKNRDQRIQFLRKQPSEEEYDEELLQLQNERISEKKVAPKLKELFEAINTVRSECEWMFQ